jgi:hypothetical protein
MFFPTSSPQIPSEESLSTKSAKIHQVRALRLNLRLRVASFVDVSRFQLRNRLAVGTKSAQSSRRCQIRRQMLGCISGDLGIVRYGVRGHGNFLFICSNNQSEGRPGRPRLVTCGLVRRKEPYIRETFVVGPTRYVHRSFMQLVLWKVHALCWLSLI